MKPQVYSLAFKALGNMIMPVDCAERDRFREAFRVATEEVARTMEAEYRLVAGHSTRLAEFNAILMRAMERRQTTMEEYNRHVLQHGCGPSRNDSATVSSLRYDQSRAMSSPALKAIGCPTKGILIDHLDKAHRLACEMGEREVHLMMHGHVEQVEALRQTIKEANESRSAAIIALGKHVDEHGC